jgi:peptidoglycan/LPS O-acetylase OafA/YrhL
MGIQVGMSGTANCARRLGRRPVLDGLRGVAILLVMLAHTSVLPNGYVGVDLFFALSGFLITSLLYEEWDRAGNISLRRFYGRRARRLLPALGVLLLIAVLVDAVCYRMTGWPFGKKALVSVLFINNWIAATGHAKQLGSLNPTWSLAQEEQFYLAWPLLLALLLRLRARPEVVAALLGLMIMTLIAAAPPSDDTHLYTVYYSPVARAAELLTGCLGAVIWRHRLVRLPAAVAARLPACVRELSARRHLWRTLIASALAYMFVRLLFDYALLTEQVYLRACMLAVPLIVMLIGAPRSLLARVVACAPLRYLGRISYALYLFHLIARNVVYHYMPGGSTDLKALLTIAASVLLASASWKLVEARVLAGGRPATRLRTRRDPVIAPRELLGASGS